MKPTLFIIRDSHGILSSADDLCMALALLYALQRQYRCWLSV